MDLGIAITDNKASFLHQVHESLATKASGDRLRFLKVFTGEFFDQYPLGDLQGKALDDIVGMILDSYRVVEENSKVRPKISCFNPDIETSGWQSSHSIVVVHCENMPFLMDSVRMALTNHDVTIHSIKSTPLMIRRDKQGVIEELLPSMSSSSIEGSEALLYFEINSLTKVKDLKSIETTIRAALRDIQQVVRDYDPIQSAVRSIKDQLSFAKKRYSSTEIAQIENFIDWLLVNSFTFLGYAYFDYKGKTRTERVCQESMGLLKNDDDSTYISDALTKGSKSRSGLVSFSKSPVRSTVHRYAYPDHIIIKAFDKNSKQVGEHHIVGLYTSSVYRASVLNIPVIREKVDALYSNINININSYNGKIIRQVLETYPRDELFQSSVEELTNTVVDISQINERHHVRLFMRRDWLGEFAYAMVYIPRDIFSSRLRTQVVKFLEQSIGAESSDFYTYYSESILSRTYIIFKMDTSSSKQWDVGILEEQVQQFSRTWFADFEQALTQQYGDEKARDYTHSYGAVFSNAYQENFSAEKALTDIEVFKHLSEDNKIAFNLCSFDEKVDRNLRFQIFNRGSSLTLSDVIPMFERMGLVVIGEHPYRLRTEPVQIWLHEFELQSHSLATSISADFKHRFETVFDRVWNQQADNDEFNGLVLAADIHWRDAVMLRAYAAYMKQTLFPFSQPAIVTALMSYPTITKKIVDLFHQSFDPDRDSNTVSEEDSNNIIQDLDSVHNLNDDRILRRYLDLLKGTVRTNFYQKSIDGDYKDYVSFKFTPREIPDIPEPRPLFEIFVYSPRVEGVHLRGGKVARGGLRWSDRMEDFRTEVLGLVKAQQVKNAVIVPSGAKGGFVAKRASMADGRDAFMKEGISCYQTFIRGLLDITDNLVKGKIIPPNSVVRRDEDDAYLVVAADKGTASFSDIANAISEEYQHWLGDAFASGGSQGYDHKGMGITARGAWVSVQRHFKEKGLNVQKEDFTVIGIGDMAGDVFGNGMLMSEHIRLTAAFNHLHIFIDPNPDSASSFKERQRLFNTAGVSWEDYNEKLISKGGGIFSRQAKSITLSPEMKTRFDLHTSKITPNDLIHALLKAPVDLIWNGGIGTYVKSRTESHADIGDKANDSLRVNGAELRCKVFGEGGNLGLSQQGRIEFCQNGGASNTDFIDNAAGVDCSDHEVNIKILLNDVMSKGSFSVKQRNRLLESMTDTVSAMVLRNNYNQTQSITVAEVEAVSRMGEYRRLISALESDGYLDRALEFIPSDELLVERGLEGKGLTRPELSVLNCYVKVILKEQLNTDEIASNQYLDRYLQRAFPDKLLKKYEKEINNHILRKEIIATQLANDIVNTMGATFCHRLMESTGETASAIALAYVAARDVFQFDDLQKQIEALDYKAPAEDQIKLLVSMMGRVRRGTRWFLRNRRESLDLPKDVLFFRESVKDAVTLTPTVLVQDEHALWQEKNDYFENLGLSTAMANAMSIPGHLFSGLGIAESALKSGYSTKDALSMHHLLGDKLGLYWFAKAVTAVTIENYWGAMARESFIDDIDKSLRMMTVSLLALASDKYQQEEAMQLWMQENPTQVSRWRELAAELQASPTSDFAMFSVAMRELSDLVDACTRCKVLSLG